MYLFNITIEFLSKKPYLGSLISFGSVISVKSLQADEDVMLSPFWVEIVSEVGLLLGVLVGVTALIINIRNILKTEKQ